MADRRDNSGIQCLFWNANRRDRCGLVAQLAAQQRADIVVLAEHGADRETTLHGLRKNVDEAFHEPVAETSRLQFFSRVPAFNLREVYGTANGRLTMRILQYEETELLLAAAHLVSPWNWSRESQAAEAAVLADEIRREEENRGHRRTILFGDLNMNPFADGIVQASGLHAMMTKSIVAVGGRTVQDREYPFFYNPMWGFFGDRTPGPPGTYYYRDSEHISYDWNILDQVLIRPDALPWFQDDIEIVTRIGETKLCRSDGRPDDEIGSDHFPIYFRIGKRK